MYLIDETSALTHPNGSVAFFSPMPFRSLAVVRNCPVGRTPDGAPDNRPRRSCRITGEPDTFFSVPAVCSIGGRKVRGFITTESTYLDGAQEGYCFIPNHP